MEEVITKEQQVKEFVLNLKALSRTIDGDAPKKPTQRDTDMIEATSQAHARIHDAFCDNFNTPDAVDAF